jgi:hypothetical protein
MHRKRLQQLVLSIYHLVFFNLVSVKPIKELEARLLLNPLCYYAAQNLGHHDRAALTESE